MEAAGYSDPRDDGRSQTYDRQGPLPDGWKCKVDQNKRRVFYYNRGRNVTCVPNQHLADGRWRCLCARVLNI